MSEVAKGGKGKRAPYATTHYRIPEPLKVLVSDLARVFRRHIDDGLSVEEATNLVSELLIPVTKFKSKTVLIPVTKYEKMMAELEVLRRKCDEQAQELERQKAAREKEPAQILNELKGRNKRSKATLADVELIQELLS